MAARHGPGISPVDCVDGDQFFLFLLHVFRLRKFGMDATYIRIYHIRQGGRIDCDNLTDGEIQNVTSPYSLRWLIRKRLNGSDSQR